MIMSNLFYKVYLAKSSAADSNQNDLLLKLNSSIFFVKFFVLLDLIFMALKFLWVVVGKMKRCSRFYRCHNNRK